MIAGALARWTVADLEDAFRALATGSEAERTFWGMRTRQWIIWRF